MRNFNHLKTGAIVFIFALVLLFSNQIFAQKTTQIDDVAIKNIIKPNGKPLLINFWATWCEPCREEFPDLVKIHQDYKDKLDVVIISLDDLAEISSGVPKFLSEMNATMPSYLLKTTNEDAAISSVSKEWQGGLPFTILFDANGATAYFKQGKFKTEILRGVIDKLVSVKKSDESVVLMDFVKIKNGKREEAMFYYENNWKLYREAALKKGVIQSYEIIEIAPADNNQFDLILITRYKNEEQYKNSEKNFEPILKEIRPNGALLKNNLKPEEFRQNLFFNVGKPVISAGI